MILELDPDEFGVDVESTVCPHHREFEGPYAGCTCTTKWTYRRATPAERKQNREERLTKELALAEKRVKALRQALGKEE